MIVYPRRIPPMEHNPDSDPRFGQRGGLTQPERTVEYVSTLEYIRDHCQAPPDYDRVMARLRARTGDAGGE
jgi:hypothetical protein